MKKYTAILSFIMVIIMSLAGCGTQEDSSETDTNTQTEVGENIDETSSVTSSAEDNIYKDGTYEGQGKGYEDAISVTVSITDGKISTIELTHDNEGNIGTKVYPDMTKAMISANSPNVDIISGATVTSNGFKEAVISALELAK